MIHNLNEWMLAWSDPLGLLGVFLVLVAYLLLQLERISALDLNYTLLNLVGSCLILISLYYHWNLASVVIEIAWLAISIFGLIKWYRKQAA